MKKQNQNSGIYNNATWIFVSRLFLTLSLVIGTYLFSHNLAPNKYGVYQNFWIQFNTIYAFAGLGLVSFMFTYTPEKLIQILKQLSYQRKALCILILVSCALIFGYFQHKAEINCFLAALFLIVNTLSIFADSFLTIFKKFKLLAVLNFAYFIAFVGAHYLYLQNVNYSFDTLIVLFTAFSLLKIIVTLLALKTVRFEGFKNDIDNNKHIKLWVHLYFFDLIQILFLYSDKFILSLTSESTLSAIYQNGTYQIPFIPIIFSAVSSATLIRFSSVKVDANEEAQILKQTGVALSTVVIPVFFFLLFFSKEFIIFFFSVKYIASVPIFQISLLMLPFKMFNFTILFQKREQGFIINKGMAIDIVVLLLALYPCFQLLGLKGIPLAFVIGTLAQVVYYVWQHVKILKLPLNTIFPVTNWVIKSLVFAFVCFLMHYFFIDVFSWPIIQSLIISSFIIGLLIIGFLYKEIKKTKARDVWH